MIRGMALQREEINFIDSRCFVRLSWLTKAREMVLLLAKAGRVSGWGQVPNFRGWCLHGDESSLLDLKTNPRSIWFGERSILYYTSYAYGRSCGVGIFRFAILLYGSQCHCFGNAYDKLTRGAVLAVPPQDLPSALPRLFRLQRPEWAWILFGKGLK